MNCHEARKSFPLYYDSEGDAGLQLEISDHLAVCPECQEWFSRQSRCESALVRLLSAGEATPTMWEAIESQVRASTCPRQRLLRLPFWKVATAALAIGAIVLVAIALRGWPHGGGAIPDLSQLAAAEHQRYVEGRWQPEVQSDSAEEVERALRPRAGFAIRCPPKGQAGFHLRGGGLCRLGQETGVHIVGDVQDRPVSVIVLPGDALKSFPRMRGYLTGEGKSHRCREGHYEMIASLLHGHVVVVLGGVKPDVLAEILQGYGSHHGSNTPDQPLRVVLR